MHTYVSASVGMIGRICLNFVLLISGEFAALQNLLFSTKYCTLFNATVHNYVCMGESNCASVFRKLRVLRNWEKESVIKIMSRKLEIANNED